VPSHLSGLLRDTLQAVAPGTELRDGLERILRGRTGALIVLGYNDDIEELCSGGFHLDIPFSATRLRELSKMDGAVVVDYPKKRIRRANVQLTPATTIDTHESGMRHRTAERVAKQTGVPVVTVSQSMRIVALYVDGHRRVVEDSDLILSRAHQALATLERYKSRLDEVAGTLSALEVENLVTVRDVTTVVQRLEMVSRISQEIDDYLLELGADGRLLSLQLDELMGGIDVNREAILRDYLASTAASVDDVLERLGQLSATELIDLSTIARALAIGGPDGESLDEPVAARGYRMLTNIPRLPAAAIEALVAKHGTLQSLLASSVDDLLQVEGIGPQRARSIREGLSRLAESSILERYI